MPPNLWTVHLLLPEQKVQLLPPPHSEQYLYIPNTGACEEHRSWRMQPVGPPSAPSSAQIRNTASYKGFLKIPNTCCIPSALPEFKGPAQDSVTVQHPKGTVTARVNSIHLQQNLPTPTLRALPHTGSIPHTSPIFSYCEELIWDWAIFQQEDEKNHIISLIP